MEEKEAGLERGSATCPKTTPITTLVLVQESSRQRFPWHQQVCRPPGPTWLRVQGSWPSEPQCQTSGEPEHVETALTVKMREHFRKCLIMIPKLLETQWASSFLILKKALL